MTAAGSVATVGGAPASAIGMAMKLIAIPRNITNPTVYEEIVVRRRGTLDGAIATSNRAVLGAILEPGRAAARIPPPDWKTLEAAAGERARSTGADPDRFDAAWAATTRS